MKSGPAGWEPHQIITRIDGWVVDPDHKDRIPAPVAALISCAMPQLGDNDVAAIRARMVARQKKVIGYV